MTITLPVPVKALRANFGHGHWAAKHKAAKTAKELSRILTLAVPVADRCRPWRGYSILAHTAARWDIDNIHSACKAYLDGIALALGVDDKEWDLIGDPAIANPIDRKAPRFEITLHPRPPPPPPLPPRAGSVTPHRYMQDGARRDLRSTKKPRR